eukprot:6188047-Pleurochrysis_carterae.AAC.1
MHGAGETAPRRGFKRDSEVWNGDSESVQISLVYSRSGSADDNESQSCDSAHSEESARILLLHVRAGRRGWRNTLPQRSGE